MTLAIVVNSPGTVRAMEQLAGVLPLLLGRSVASATEMLREHIVKDKLSGTPLRARSGTLRRSINTTLSSDGREVVGVISTSVPYAGIQEFGGTIEARSAANLTIPLAPALDSSGEARFTARELIANPALGGFRSTFVRKQILFGVAAGGAITPLFKLQSSVTLPARSFFGSALAEKQAEILSVFVSGLAEVF